MCVIADVVPMAQAVGALLRVCWDQLTHEERAALEPLLPVPAPDAPQPSAVELSEGGAV